ncbi:hypothetical protein FRB99_007346 [Tulasnella sp. 403]|nr:hypothetical protein FRB99_007346 [Tulasnella sp. 403]
MFITRLIDQGFPPASAFDVDRDIPDLGGKVVIVTGGNTGIGKETVKALLKKNAKVYLAARSKARAEGAISELKTETGKEAIFLELDLADLGKVSRAAEEFQRKEKELHILFNSAYVHHITCKPIDLMESDLLFSGVMIPPIDQLTADGYDLQFGTNVLGPAHFTLSLLPILLSTAKSSPPGTVRVVNTSSFVVYRQVASVRFDTLRDGPERKELGTKKLYDQSKYGVLAFSNELARRYGSKGIHSNAVNPGNLRTDLQRHIPAAARVIVVSPPHLAA